MKFAVKKSKIQKHFMILKKEMKVFLILWLTGFILGWLIWYLVSYANNIPRFSQIVSVKTLDWVRYYNFLYSKLLWDTTEKTVCYWSCRNYSSSSSRWSSSRGGGK